MTSLPCGRDFIDDRLISPGSGSLDRSGDEGRNSILHRDRVGRIRRMTPYHDRIPVLLRAEDLDAWLNGSLGADALRPAAESALREWPVSRRVNRTGVGDDDPTIIEKVEAA
jgi:hypothetical protein